MLADLDRDLRRDLETGMPFFEGFASIEDMQETWESLGDELLAAWIEKHPGTRPFAWWLLEHGRERPVVLDWDESSLEAFRAHARFDFLDTQIWHPGKGWLQETEEAYLKRHGLLTPDEVDQLEFDRYEGEPIVSDHQAEIEAYMASVADGMIRTGRLERLAIYRQQEDWRKAGDRGYCFDVKLANRAIDFAPICRQFESPFAGKPLKLRADQKFCAWCVYGWLHISDGYRRFTQEQREVGRKGGKSTEAAYRSCYGMFSDMPKEYGAQIYIEATKQEQATVVWRSAMNMIRKSPDLDSRAKIAEYDLKITVPHLSSIFKPLASDKTPDGFNPHLIIKDEEHAYREKHRRQADAMLSGFGTRAQRLVITITTYGDDESILWQESHAYAVRVLESVITGEIVDDTWFVFSCAMDVLQSKEQTQECYRCKGPECPWCDGSGFIPSDDPYDERNFRKANPGIGLGVGHTPRLETMRDYAREAKNRPEKRPEYLQKNCNIIISSQAKLITTDAWAACADELRDPKTADRVHGGFDLSKSGDMTGAAILALFNLIDDDGLPFVRFEARAKAWTCKERPKNTQTAQVARWIADGLLNECDGDQIRFSDVEDWIAEQSRLKGVSTWAFDPRMALQMGQNLQETHHLTIYEFPQNHGKYNEPLDVLMRALREVRMVGGKPVRAFAHDGDPVLAWMMTNMVCNKNSRGLWMPDKGASANKIDLAVSVVMAISECLFSETIPTGKYYETHDVEFV